MNTNTLPFISVKSDIYDDYFNVSLQKLKEEGRYRYFQTILRNSGCFPQAHHFETEQNVIVWCSNDYLGMGQNPKVLTSMQEALENYGAGAGGTRNISGTHKLICTLEKEVADLHNKEAGLVFTSGYIANEATLSSLTSQLPECVVFSDSKNHASMIHGMRAGKAKRIIFAHNDINLLEEALYKNREKPYKIIAFESVYSMDGDVAPIKDICLLAKKYNALTYLDEVHAVGIYGHQGAGMAQQLGCMEDIDIIQGTFAKAYGIMGGYIAAKASCVDFVRSHASSFIFSTSLAPALTAGILTSIQHLRHSNAERQALHRNVKGFLKKLQLANIEAHNESTHIFSIFIRDPILCRKISERLLHRHKIYIQPINYPTVDKGQERLRISVTALHNDTMQDQLIYALKDTLDYYNIQ